MKTTRTINAILGEPWAATSEEIEKVWMVVNRFGDPESLRGRSDAELDKTEATLIRNGVAVVSVTGPLVRYAGLLSEISGATSYSRVAKDLGEALRSPKVKKIILDINSGGGTVDGCQELVEHILEARKVKPVVAYIGGTGCSAAYWLASACEKIYAAETSITGSIGVQLIVPPEEKDGSLAFLSSHSPNKNASPHKDKGKAEAQRIVDDLGEIFVSSVATNRNISKEEVLKNYGQGSVFVGPDALKRGLIDEISGMEKLLLQEKGKDLNAEEIKKNHPKAYEEIFNLGAGSIDQKKLKSDAKVEAQKEERDRVAQILDLKGSQKSTREMITEGKSAGDAAIAFRKEELDKPSGASSGGLRDLLEAERDLNPPGAGSGQQSDEVSLDAALKLFEKSGGYN